MPRAPLVYRVLLRLCYPADVVERNGREIEEALVACVVRERARLGLLGAVYAWMRALDDLFLAAILTRLDARRARRIAALHHLVRPNGDDPMSNLRQDVRYSFRMVRRAPLSSAIVVLTLALAIGANTTIFGVVDAVVLRPLPYSRSGAAGDALRGDQQDTGRVFRARLPGLRGTGDRF